MANEFVTVFSSWSVETVNLARIHLAEENIPAFVTDDQTVAMDWGLCNAIHGTKLVVKAEDAQRAHEILNQKGEIDPTELDREFEQDAAEEPADQDLDVADGDAQVLDNFRGIKRPVILLLLAPMFLYALGIFGWIMASIIDGLAAKFSR